MPRGAADPLILAVMNAGVIRSEVEDTHWWRQGWSGCIAIADWWSPWEVNSFESSPYATFSMKSSDHESRCALPRLQGPVDERLGRLNWCLLGCLSDSRGKKEPKGFFGYIWVVTRQGQSEELFIFP